MGLPRSTYYAIAIGLKLIADRRDIGDDLSVVSLHRQCVAPGWC